MAADGSGKWLVDEYFETGWVDSTHPAMPLPVALDLKTLYEQMLFMYIDLPPRDGEALEINLGRHLADQSTRNRNARKRVVLSEIHWRHHQRRLDELLDRMDRAQHAVLRGEDDPVGNLYKLPEEREVL